MELGKYGVEVELVEHFSVIRESLDRIGIANRNKKILNPSCYLLHKKGKYYVIHFKQLLELDGNQTTFSEDDKIRTVSIAKLLDSWKLVKIKNPELYEDSPNIYVFVLPYKEKPEWEIRHKYSIGFSH
jgi:hypothetical protein